MTFEVIDGGQSKDPSASGRKKPKAQKSTSKEERVLAPGAPPSPGTAPFELARELPSDEALLWWNQKQGIAWSSILWTLGGGAFVLALVTLFVPEFWQRPWQDWWKPALVPLLPAAFIFLRERISQRIIGVTDRSIVEVNRRGRGRKIGRRNLRKVRRDMLSGGIRLEALHHRILIPFSLEEAAQKALELQSKAWITREGNPVDDSTGWLPK